MYAGAEYVSSNANLKELIWTSLVTSNLKDILDWLQGIKDRRGILVHGPHRQPCKSFGHDNDALCPAWIENETNLHWNQRAIPCVNDVFNHTLGSC